MKETLSDLWHYPDAVLATFFDRMVALGWSIDLLEIAGYFFWSCLALQLLYAVAARKRDNLWDPLGNLSCYAFTAALELTFYGVIVIGAFLLLEDVQIATIPITPWTWVACLLLTDFNYYWYHRVQHRVRILWGVHSVHHSSEEYDLTTGVRLFVFGDFILWIYFAPMVLIGFDAAQVLTCMLIIFTWAAWLHFESVPKLGPLEYLFATPSNHRVHHGKNPQYLDKNYGGMLIIWDRMLGTFQPEEEKVRYGLTKPVGTSDPVRFNLYEFIAIFRDLRAARNWWERWLYIIKPPGWHPGPGQLSQSGSEDRTTTIG